MRVGEISRFPAAAPLPHGGIVKGSRAQPTRKTTMGYSYPAGGGEAEEHSSLRLRSQVSTAAVRATKDPSHPTSRRKSSGDTPHKAPTERGGEPHVSTPALRERAAGEN